MATPPTRDQLLAVIAEVEELTRTLARFPELDRAQVLEILRWGRLRTPGARPTAPTQASLFAPPAAPVAAPAPVAVAEPAAKAELPVPPPAPALAPPRVEGGYERLHLATDGACRGNPGPASVGVVITTPDGQVVDSIARAIGKTTNNVAEYEAVRTGLIRAEQLGASSVLLRADSELVVKQLRGEYQVKNATLRPIYEAIKQLERRFSGGVKYQHVRRELNADADALANAALDQLEA